MSWQAMKSERDERELSEGNPFLSSLDAALLVGGASPAYIMD